MLTARLYFVALGECLTGKYLLRSCYSECTLLGLGGFIYRFSHLDQLLSSQYFGELEFGVCAFALAVDGFIYLSSHSRRGF